MMKRHYFNMIEIILAISILAIGISSVMGLFVVSMRTGSQTVVKAQEPDVAESVLAYIKSEIYKKCNETGWGTLNIPTVADSDWKIENDTVDKVGADKWNASEDDKVLHSGPDGSGYYLYRKNNAVKNGNKIEYVPSFTAMIRIRKKDTIPNITVSNPVTPEQGTIAEAAIKALKNSDGKTLENVSADFRNVFEVRISYPGDAAPGERTVTTHIVELFNDKYNRASGEGGGNETN
ncbi:MAG: hypothetical protein IKB99_00660 [Lentisphaeria bacterium]|nr:hypothetical protein [Lentisphaeria bacterium]